MRSEMLGRKAIRLIDRVTDQMIQIALVVVLFFGVYSLWDTRQVYDSADAANYTAYKPTTEDTVSFEELQRKNSEVIAWLTVNDTPIDYPMTQASNNNKYINTNAEGQYTLSGAIFLDYRNRPDFEDFNTVVYGHHMEEKKMFGPLSDFADRVYFDTHPYGGLFYGGRDHGLEFFALILTDAYDDKLFTPAQNEPAERTALLDYIRSTALYMRDIPVSEEDRIILLSTCTSDITNGRYMLVGKITDELHPQIVRKPKPVVRFGNGIEKQIGRFTSLPVGVWIVLLLLLIAAAVWADRACTRYRRARKNTNNTEAGAGAPPVTRS